MFDRKSKCQSKKSEVITFTSLNVTRNGMDADIMDGLGGFLCFIPTALLGLAGAD